MSGKGFTVNGVNYTMASDGVTFTITKEGDANPMYTDNVDQTLTPEQAMQGVMDRANTFLIGAFPGFVAEFLAIFDKLVVTITAGVPFISIGA